VQPSGHLRADDRGHLWVEDCDTVELAERFGTPLYVISESQVRGSYRALHGAFASRYPDVVLAYGIKANNNLAVVRILAQEGAGADCFGPGELEVARRAGVAPGKTVLNGSDKWDPELEQAVQLGVTVNVDNLEELERLGDVAERLGRRARINLRLKLPLRALEKHYIQDYRYVPPRISLAAWARGHKFGMELEEAEEAGKRALRDERLQLAGLHYHLKGQTPQVEHFAAMVCELVDAAARLATRLDWVPEQLDLGGGFSYGRAEGYGPGARDREVPTPDHYAEAMIGALREGLEHHGLPEPRLMLEPGRLLVAAAGLLLARVGTVKRSEAGRWVHVDASTNHLLRVRTGNWYYHMLLANRVANVDEERVDVVGGTCDAADILGRDRRLPRARRGDLLAVLDVGAYAESTTCQFNTQPRPATVLVRGADAELITRRESVQDVIGRYCLPSRLVD